MSVYFYTFYTIVILIKQSNCDVHKAATLTAHSNNSTALFSSIHVLITSKLNHSKSVHNLTLFKIWHWMEETSVLFHQLLPKSHVEITTHILKFAFTCKGQKSDSPFTCISLKSKRFNGEITNQVLNFGHCKSEKKLSCTQATPIKKIHVFVWSIIVHMVFITESRVDNIPLGTVTVTTYELCFAMKRPIAVLTKKHGHKRR